jgi:hypothetical protein
MQHENTILLTNEIKKSSALSFKNMAVILSCLLFLSSCSSWTKTSYDHNASSKRHYYKGHYQGEHNHPR